MPKTKCEFPDCNKKADYIHWNVDACKDAYLCKEHSDKAAKSEKWFYHYSIARTKLHNNILAKLKLFKK
jgi:hypothetical protein